MPLHHTPITEDDMPPSSPIHQEIPLRETVMILDWDDTLMCSSFLAVQNVHLNSPLVDLTQPLSPTASIEMRQAREVSSQIKDLEVCVYQLLQNCIQSVDRTIIITNAEQGWVQLSAAKFFPSILPLLPSLTIISARTCFEHLFPDSPLKWKYYSMHSSLVGGNFFGSDGRKEVDKHVVSLGDSHVEREAVRALCKGVPATRCKTVKFSERPSCEQLRRQLELVNQCFGYITTHAGDLDLQLTVTMNSSSNAAQQAAAAPSYTKVPHTLSTADDALTTTEAKDISPSHTQSKLAHAPDSRNAVSMEA